MGYRGTFPFALLRRLRGRSRTSRQDAFDSGNALAKVNEPLVQRVEPILPTGVDTPQKRHHGHDPGKIDISDKFLRHGRRLPIFSPQDLEHGPAPVNTIAGCVRTDMGRCS